MEEISLDEYMATMPTGLQASPEVYERLRPALEEAAEQTADDTLGDSGLQAMATDSLLRACFARHVAYAATLASMDELNIVLTPTGFGIVSNETTAPASKDRTESLREDLRHQLAKADGRLIDRLTRLDSWADSRQAARSISAVVWNIADAERRLDRQLQSDEWRTLQVAANDVHQRMVCLVGRRQMEALLQRIRSHQWEQPYTSAIDMIEELTFKEALHSPGQHELERELLRWMERYPEQFADYMDSDEYEANHWQRFQNQQDAAAFCFMG